MLKYKMFFKLSSILLQPILSLLFIGFVIGQFHQYDIFLLGFLILIFTYRFYKEIKINPYKYKIPILLIGTLISSFFGVLAEIWGIENGYWLYHDLSENRQFPYWLPLAWGLTFMFFYRLEERILKEVNINSFKVKLYLVVFLSAFLPTWGEIITINLGVWTYTWPLQLFGVPLLAIFLLVIFHTVIFLLFTYYCKKLDIHNPIFNNKINT